jgi:KDO2-lipid IV(A) lauroyltransferase
VKNLPLRFNRDDLIAGLFRFSIRVAKVLPYDFGVALSRSMGLAAYYIAKGARQTLEDNLKRIVGDDPRVLAKAVRNAFASYAMYYFSTFKFASMDADDVTRLGTISGKDRMFEALSKGKGAIVISPHIGNWDYGAAFFKSNNVAATAVVEHLQSESIYQFFNDLRKNFGAGIIAHDDNPFPKMVSALERNELLILISDRSLDATTIEVDFFNSKVKFPLGAAFLALRTGAPLLPMSVLSLPNGRFHIDVGPLLNLDSRGSFKRDAQVLSQRIANYFEDVIRRSPSQWHVFSPFFK